MHQTVFMNRVQSVTQMCFLGQRINSLGKGKCDVSLLNVFTYVQCVFINAEA